MLTAFMIGLAASATAPSPSVATAGPDEVIAPAFTGTIISTYPDGRISKLWLNRDGSFLVEGRAHEHQAGRWRIKGRAVCMTQLKPVPIPFLSYCAPIPTTGVDVAWTGKAVTGEPIVIRLEPQR